MTTPIAHETLEAGENGWGAFIQIVSDFDDENAIGKISAQIQIYSEGRREEHAEFVLKFSAISGFDFLDMDTAVRGSKYIACIAASVGASIWSDVSDCKQQANEDNPDASWSEIWRVTVNCAKTKNSKAKKALQVAMIACSSSLF